MNQHHKQNETQIYQLRAIVRLISPLIWRRLLVESDATLAELHDILQITFGWDDYHLHRFNIRGKEYGINYVGGLFFSNNARKFTLANFDFRISDRFVYEYDYTDAWLHDIEIETITPPDHNKSYPICIAGKRAAPPEDCGGCWRYSEILHHIKYRTFEYDEMMEDWIYRDFDPEAFDRMAVNGALKAWTSAEHSL
jgi:hypothetical protein